MSSDSPNVDPTVSSDSPNVDPVVSSDSPDVEKISSEACTKAGSFGLLLSLLLLLTIPYWRNEPNYTALADYISARIRLSAEVELLADSPHWKTYLRSQPDGEATSIAALNKVTVEVVAPEEGANLSYRPKKEVKRKQDTAQKRPTARTGTGRPAAPSMARGSTLTAQVVERPTDKAPINKRPAPPTLASSPSSQPKEGSERMRDEVQQGSTSTIGTGRPAAPSLESPTRKRPITKRPAAPTGLTVKSMIGISEAEGIAVSLKELNRQSQLDNARKISNFFNVSIARWQYKKAARIYRNYIDKKCSNLAVEVEDVAISQNEKDAVQRDNIGKLDTKGALLNCLTVRDVQELSSFEFPSMSNTIEIGTRIRPDIDLTAGGLPHELTSATVVVEVLLVFTLIYFGVLTGEATRSKSFPTAGTLFAAYSRHWWARLTLLLAICAPGLSALSVAFFSRHLPALIGSLFVVAAEAPVLYFLGKSYFWSKNKPTINRSTKVVVK